MPMILSLWAVLDGGVIEPETRLEIPVEPGTERITFHARLVDGRVALSVAPATKIAIDGGDLMVALDHAAHDTLLGDDGS